MALPSSGLFQFLCGAAVICCTDRKFCFRQNSFFVDKREELEYNKNAQNILKPYEI